jgi:hypothetical protein
MAATAFLVPVHARSFAHDRPDDLRTFVTLTRTDAADVGLREVFVRIDDAVRVRLMFGQSCTIEVLPGSHRLRAHNTLMWRTIAFAVEPGEHLEFAILNHRGPLLQVLLAFIPSPVMLYVRRRSLL